MTCKCSIILSIINIYLFLLTLMEIGLSIYEDVQFMEKPDNYSIYYIQPKITNDLDVKNCNVVLAFLTPQYIGQIGKKGEVSDSCMKFNQTCAFNGSNIYNNPIINRGSWNYSNLIFYGRQTEFDAKIVSKATKIVTIVFQNIQILVLLSSLVVEYFKIWPRVCTQKSSYFIYLLFDILLIPFFGFKGVQFGEQCIQQTTMLKFMNLGAWFIWPFVMIFFGVGFFFIFTFLRAGCCLIFLIISIAGFVTFTGLIMASMNMSTPLPILILMLSKIVIQMLMALYNCCKKQDADPNMERPSEKNQCYKDKQLRNDKINSSLAALN